MASGFVDFRDLDSLLAQFKRQNTPFFLLYEGKELKLTSKIYENDTEGNAVAEAVEQLEDNLEAIKSFGSTATYRIEYYRDIDKDGRYRKEDKIGSNTFKLNEREDGGHWEGRSYINPELERLRAANKVLQDELNGYGAKSDLEGEDEDEDEDKGIMGSLMAGFMPILKQPEVQQAIAGRLIQFLDTILPKKTIAMQQGQNAQVNGISQADWDTLCACLDQLMKAGMTVSDFERLVALTRQPATFNMYLNALRSSAVS